MKVEIVKRADGAGVLRCIRDDGSTTWQKQTGRHAAYFALHDLTHFAVESTLGLREGFFGLMAQGWDVDDTTGKGARGPLPGEAGLAEALAGLFFGDYASGGWTTEEINRYSPRVLSEEQIAGIRACRSELFAQWAAVPAGGSLSLEFSL